MVSRAFFPLANEELDTVTKEVRGEVSPLRDSARSQEEEDKPASMTTQQQTGRTTQWHQVSMDDHIKTRSPRARTCPP